MSISTKEQLREHIHGIHNYLRNNGAGYGMPAMKIFNLFYGLKLIEPMLGEFNLSNKCKFSKLVKMAKKGEGEEILDKVVGPILDELYKNEKIKKLICYEIPRDLCEEVYAQIILDVHKIPVKNSDNINTSIDPTYDVDISGKIYEYFIGRDATAISELGAYFTDRQIVTYIMNKLNLKVSKKGKIKTMIDPFGGSGGFTLMYARCMKEYAQKNNIILNWKKESNKIYHCDVNEDVVKSAGLEMFSLTKTFPNRYENFVRDNSFTREFGKKYHYIITNPPYGGDKTKQTATQLRDVKKIAFLKNKRKDDAWYEENKWVDKKISELQKSIQNDKNEQDNKKKVQIVNCSLRIKEYAKINKDDPACKKRLPSSNKEGCSLILMMSLLKEGGTCVGVLKEGLFFDNKYSGLREKLIKNFNIKYIISVPSDQFENTTTKTSIIFFENTPEKTSEVIFYDLIVNKEPKDVFLIKDKDKDIILLKNKGDIIGVEDKEVARVTLNQLLKKNEKGKTNYSLDVKQYNQVDIKCTKKYKMVKIGDICDIKYGKRITKSKNGVGDNYNGQRYPVYSGGNITFYTNNKNRDNHTLIVSRFAVSKECARLVTDDFYLNDGGLSLHTFENKYQEYINHFILTIQSHIFKLTGGTIQRGLNIPLFKGFKIPIPKTDKLLNKWVKKISEPYNLAQKKKEKLKKTEQEVKDEIQRIIDEEDCEEHRLGNLCELQDGYDFYRNQMDPDKIYKLNVNYPLLKINNNNISDYIIINKKYEKYKVVKGDFVMGTKGSCGNIRIVDIEKGYHKHGLLKFMNININKNYLYYVIKQVFSKEYIEKITTKSVLSNMKKENIVNTYIPIPKDKSLIKNIESKFKLIETLKNNIKKLEKEYNNVIQKLGNDAIVCDKLLKIDKK